MIDPLNSWQYSIKERVSWSAKQNIFGFAKLLVIFKGRPSSSKTNKFGARGLDIGGEMGQRDGKATTLRMENCCK